MNRELKGYQVDLHCHLAVGAYSFHITLKIQETTNIKQN